MTDLTGKFTALETQLTSNHEEIMNALDAIATALGAPPPGPTTTLADVVSALTQSNVITQGIRTDMNTKLDGIYTLLDTMNNNASLNAQLILSTLLQTACPCDTTIPLLPPDLTTAPIDATDLAKCQRIQYFIDLFAAWAIKVGVYVGDHSTISSFQINNLLQIQLQDVDISTGQLEAGMPTSTRDTIVGLLVNAASVYGATSVDTGLFNAMTDAVNLEALRQALYSANSAVDGKEALDTAINGLGLASWLVVVLRTMFYSAWLNDIYSDVPAVDVSAYDGTVCAPEVSECIELTSVHGSLSSGFAGQIISYAIPGATLSATVMTSSGEVTSTPAEFVGGNYEGWTLRCISGNMRVIYRTDGLSSSQLFSDHSFLEGAIWTFPATGTIGIDNSFVNDVPFTIRLCPPGVDNPPLV